MHRFDPLPTVRLPVRAVTVNQASLEGCSTDDAAFCASLAWGMLGVLNRPSSGAALIGLYIGLALIAVFVSSRWWRPVPLVLRRNSA